MLDLCSQLWYVLILKCVHLLLQITILLGEGIYKSQFLLFAICSNLCNYTELEQDPQMNLNGTDIIGASPL
jgi:hypothetical protein